MWFVTKTHHLFVYVLRGDKKTFFSTCPKNIFNQQKYCLVPPQKTKQIMSLSRCLSVLDFWNVNLGVYYKLEKKSISNQTWFFFEFKLDFYCLCSLQKSILKSNWFFHFLNLIFWNWKKIEWHSIFQKSSGDSK